MIAGRDPRRPGRRAQAAAGGPEHRDTVTATGSVTCHCQWRYYKAQRLLRLERC